MSLVIKEKIGLRNLITIITAITNSDQGNIVIHVSSHQVRSLSLSTITGISVLWYLVAVLSL